MVGRPGLEPGTYGLKDAVRYAASSTGVHVCEGFRGRESTGLNANTRLSRDAPLLSPAIVPAQNDAHHQGAFRVQDVQPLSVDQSAALRAPERSARQSARGVVV